MILSLARLLEQTDLKDWRPTKTEKNKIEILLKALQKRIKE
jgi:hypothetical protein